MSAAPQKIFLLFFTGAKIAPIESELLQWPLTGPHARKAALYAQKTPPPSYEAETVRPRARGEAGIQ
jgi:hypothetical protein